ncbi:bag family molecular chaperone regulator 7 [Phtheirospermum japonicum]|uniref:Bag family molecular chaperone regulator 7 n=1 Tax=Phtheirospermum japonicum TaxID=374723 RepID=A0A830CSG5_9LAMI|nr:bag family molecular chaperone regulator 7 [Phtheirospermum japonicum]
MSRFRRFDIVERRPSSYFLNYNSIFTPPKTLFQNPHFPSFPIFEDIFEDEIDHALDLASFPHPRPTLFDDFDAVTDLIQIERTPFRTSTRRVTRRVGPDELYLQKLCDRVSDLELGLERLAREEKKARKKRIGERKYTWTAEIDRPEEDRKYNWTAEIKDGKRKKKGLEKSYKWTAQINGKGSKHLPIERTYTVKVQSEDVSSGSEDEMKKKREKVKGKGKLVGPTARIVEIEEPSGNNGGIVLRQVFAKRLEKKKGKRIELSPQDAAALIQTNYRAYLIRRSQALRALRELAIAKNRLKELRTLFSNFTYRQRLSKDAEERQRFSEKIIVLLLTVDTIEGSDSMVRAAKRSMVDELEEMLDVVDPQPSGRPNNTLTRRRTFDMPDGTINKELAAGVAQVVQMLGQQEPTGSDTFEV